MAKLVNDFKALSLDDMKATLDELSGIYQDAVDAERARLMEALEKLGGVPKPKAPVVEGRTRASPKVTHRGPNKEEWRSRGAQPKWLATLVAEGYNADDFRIGDSGKTPFEEKKAA